jgi:uncharacterized membrane protein YcaP (DUF421 family)
VLLASVVSDLLTMGIPVSEKVIRTVSVYAGILVLLRLAGKRNLAQLNSFDLVVLLLLSNVVQNAVIGSDNSLLGGLLGALILVAANAAVVRLARRRAWAVRLFEGSPTLVIRDGQLVEPALHRLGMRDADVLNTLRHEGANHLQEVEKAVLEPGGAIVVTLRRADENATRADIDRLDAKLDRVLKSIQP